MKSDKKVWPKEAELGEAEEAWDILEAEAKKAWERYAKLSNERADFYSETMYDKK